MNIEMENWINFISKKHTNSSEAIAQWPLWNVNLKITNQIVGFCFDQSFRKCVFNAFHSLESISSFSVYGKKKISVRVYAVCIFIMLKLWFFMLSKAIFDAMNLINIFKKNSLPDANKVWLTLSSTYYNICNPLNAYVHFSMLNQIYHQYIYVCDTSYSEWQD